MKKNVALFALMMAFHMSLFCQWTNDPLINTTIVEGQGIFSYRMTRSNQSSTYVSWKGGNSPYHFSIYLLDEFGRNGWDSEPDNFGDNYINIAWSGFVITVDNNGALIISASNLIKYGGDTDIVLYKVDENGVLVWGKEGLVVSEPGYNDWQLTMDVDENNNIIIAYVSFINELDVCKVFIHKISPDGTKAWASSGLEIGDALFSYKAPQISVLPGGEILIAYLKEMEGYIRGEHEILANKIDPEGNLMWEKDLVISNSHKIPPSNFLTSKVGPNGELILGWHECPYSDFLATSNFQIINPDGSTWFWQGGYHVSTNYNANQFYPNIAGIGDDGNLYVFWEQTDWTQDVRDLYGQCISPEEGRLWGDYGIKFFDSIPNRDLVTGLVNDSIMLTFTHDTIEGGGPNILYAAGISRDGKYAWKDSLLELGRIDAEKIEPIMPGSDTDETVICWMELLPNGERAIKVQNIFNDGSIGSKTNSVEIPKVRQNHFLGYNPENQKLYFQNLLGNEKVIIRDLTGRLITTCPASEILEVSSLTSGLYFFELYLRDCRIETGKFIINR